MMAAATDNGLPAGGFACQPVGRRTRPAPAGIRRPRPHQIRITDVTTGPSPGVRAVHPVRRARAGRCLVGAVAARAVRTPARVPTTRMERGRPRACAVRRHGRSPDGNAGVVPGCPRPSPAVRAARPGAARVAVRHGAGRPRARAGCTAHGVAGIGMRYSRLGPSPHVRAVPQGRPSPSCVAANGAVPARAGCTVADLRADPAALRFQATFTDSGKRSLSCLFTRLLGRAARFPGRAALP